jgi:type IV pilus assembly protein PilB
MSRKQKVGELLLAQGLITREQLDHAVAEHKRTGLLLGKIIVRLGLVDEDTMSSVLGAQIQLKDKKRIGEVLVDQGFISREQLQKALDEQRAKGMKIGKCLVRLGYITEEKLLEALSAQLDMPQVKLENFKFDLSVVSLLPEDMCRNYKVVPLYISGKTLTIAMADPTNLRTQDHIKFKTQMDVDAVMASEQDIVAALDKVYGASKDTLSSLLNETEEELQTIERAIDDSDDEDELSDEEGQQVVKIVSTIINEAVAKGASDIHLEPQETYLQLRYRVDGELMVNPPIPGRLMGQIISRLKILSKMDIAEKRKPLDGRFTVRFKGKEVDLRVSSFPTMLRKRGVMEKIVIRILDPQSITIPLDDMGFQPHVLAELKEKLRMPNGIVLVTGPTGSGKSTTLYACIREINDPSLNITTMEDPVELNLDGVSQGQINKAAGFTFAAGLRAILRQDPDVIMLGEMRDQETSQMAIESALTGHLVLSTLHTNDSSGAFPRLLDMGLEPFLVTSALKGVLAQRLVRRICKRCKETYEPNPEVLNSYGIAPGTLLYRGKGCNFCDGSGYKGRLGVFEFLVPNEAIRAMVLRHASADEIKREALLNCGMITLRMDGIKKAVDGLTTLEEVIYASQADD